MMLPLREYEVKTKVGLTRDKRSGQNPFMSIQAPGGGKSRKQNKK